MNIYTVAKWALLTPLISLGLYWFLLNESLFRSVCGVVGVALILGSELSNDNPVRSEC